MPTNSLLSIKVRKFVFVGLLLLICVLLAYWIVQQNKPWIVPAEFKALKNPLLPTPSNLSSAKQIYADQCMQCHGERGQGDGPEARSHFPLPADLTDAKHMAGVTDGEIFYQIREGRRPMPSFKHSLTQNQLWQLVLYVRSFSQPPSSDASLPKQTEK